MFALRIKKGSLSYDGHVVSNIYIYIYICSQRVMSSVQHFPGERLVGGGSFLQLGISAFIITFHFPLFYCCFLKFFMDIQLG
jgi:hypothetical protein